MPVPKALRPQHGQSFPYAEQDASRCHRAAFSEQLDALDLYELAEELVDLEDWFRQRRFRQVTRVERIIGHKAGTGGTSGVVYLRRAIDLCCFFELRQVRTELSARAPIAQTEPLR
jgi:tryptophan 2,3-dioxygenase